MSNQILRYAQFDQEGVGGTGYGTEKAQGAVGAVYEDITGASLDAANDSTMLYGGGIGRSPKIPRPGYYAPTGNVVFAPRLETLGQYLFWVLGDGAADGEMWGAEGVLLPTFNTRIGKDLFEHLFLGCAANSLQLTVNDSFLELTLDIVAQKDKKAALQAIDDLSLGSISPLAFHEVHVTAGFTDCKVRSMTLNIGNSVDADSGRGIGSRFPCLLRAGQRETSLEMELYFDDTSELEAFWGAATGPDEASVPTEFGLTFEIKQAGSATGAPLITLELPRCIYTAQSLQPSGRDRMEQSVTITPLQHYFALDDKNSEIKATVGTIPA